MDIITAKNAPEAIGPYSHAVSAGGFVFTSGQLGLNSATGALPEGIEAQAEQAMKNLGEVLRAAGLGFADVVKTTCFLKSMDDFAAFNAVYAKYFTGKPARSCVAVAALPKGALVEVEAVASRK